MNEAAIIVNVDDNEPARYARSRILKTAGFDVHDAATAKRSAGEDCRAEARCGAPRRASTGRQWNRNLPAIKIQSRERLAAGDPNVRVGIDGSRTRRLLSTAARTCT